MLNLPHTMTEMLRQTSFPEMIEMLRESCAIMRKENRYSYAERTWLSCEFKLGDVLIWYEDTIESAKE